MGGNDRRGNQERFNIHVNQPQNTVILPVGCTEQHGYHLPVSVDILNAIELGKRVSAKIGVALLPVINYSYSGGELPGTINVSPNILSLYLEEICLSLASQNVKNIIVLLGHGGSENTGELIAFRDLFLRKHQHLDLALAVIPPTFLLGEDGTLYKKGDWHAGKTETSLMLYWAPQMVYMDRIQYDSQELLDMMRADPDAYQDIQQVADSSYVGPRVRQKREIQVGVMGYPEEACAEIGEKIAQNSVEEIAKIILKIEERL